MTPLNLAIPKPNEDLDEEMIKERLKIISMLVTHKNINVNTIVCTCSSGSEDYIGNEDGEYTSSTINYTYEAPLDRALQLVLIHGEGWKTGDSRWNFLKLLLPYYSNFNIRKWVEQNWSDPEDPEWEDKAREHIYKNLE